MACGDMHPYSGVGNEFPGVRLDMVPTTHTDFSLTHSLLGMYLLMFFASASCALLPVLELVGSFPDRSVIVASGVMKSKRRTESRETQREANLLNCFLPLL